MPSSPTNSKPKIKVTAEVIAGFVQSLLYSKFDNPVNIPPCHLEWWDMCCAENKFVAIAAPRNHAKSTAITLSYILTKVVFRESQYVVIVSDTEAQSILFLGDLKAELADNDNLAGLFGVAPISDWEKVSESELIVKFLDGHLVRLLAKGAGQSMRGLKWRNLRPDLIVCDDMENDEMVMNQDRRIKLKRWVSSTLFPIRSKTGIIRMVGTILHDDSMLNSFMPQEHDKDVIDTGLCLIPTKPRQWLARLYRAHPAMNDFSKILWPERWSEKELRHERDSYVARGLGDLYSQEYLNRPIDEENAQFRKNDLLPLREKDKEENVTFYVGCDLAVTEKQKADFTTFVIGGLTPESKLQIRYVLRERMDSKKIVDTIIDLQRMYDPHCFVFEKGTITNSILPHLNQSMQETGVFVSMEMMASVTDKVQRAQSIRARCRAGMVRFDQESGWWPAFEDELLKFPRGKHDDQVDAFALLGQIINKMMAAKTKKEIEEEEYEDELEATGYAYQGRNATTGY